MIVIHNAGYLVSSERGQLGGGGGIPIHQSTLFTMKPNHKNMLQNVAMLDLTVLKY